MSEAISGPLTLNLKKDDVICISGEHNYDLYMIHSGKLIVMVNNGTKVTPLAYLNAGEYLGELSFFDHAPRSAHVVCLEDTTLFKVPIEEKENQFPAWLNTIALSITKKLRHSNDLILKKGIRKQNVESVKPFSIEEQRHYYQLLQKYCSENNIEFK